MYESPVRDKCRELLTTPHSSETLAAAAGMSRPCASIQIRKLKRAGEVYLCHWETHTVEDYEYVTPFYRVGNGPDAPRPSSKPRCRPRLPVKAPRCLELMERLGDFTTTDLASAAGAGRCYTAQLINQHRSLLHICGWRPPAKQGSHAPIYRFGPGEDVPEPPPTPQKDIQRQYRKANREKIRRQHRASVARKALGFTPFFMQLVGASKAWRPKEDFSTPEPDVEDCI